jgi:hypothetical protein
MAEPIWLLIQRRLLGDARWAWCPSEFGLPGHGLVLERSDEMPPLATAMSLSPELTKGQINAAAINGVQWGARLVLATILLHFPKLEFKLLGSGYNANLMSDEMETLWTWTRRASESLSSRVPLLAAQSPPNGAREE